MAQNSQNYSLGILEKIRRRATEIFERRGRLQGYDLDNWCQAEAEVLREFGAGAVRRAVVVDVAGTLYTGEYDCLTADYYPGEWQPGDSVRVRLEGENLYLRRPNGRELCTTIVKRIG